MFVVSSFSDACFLLLSAAWFQLVVYQFFCKVSLSAVAHFLCCVGQ